MATRRVRIPVVYDPFVGLRIRILPTNGVCGWSLFYPHYSSHKNLWNGSHVSGGGSCNAFFIPYGNCSESLCASDSSVENKLICCDAFTFTFCKRRCLRANVYICYVDCLASSYALMVHMLHL